MTDTPTVTPHLDSHGNPSAVVAGELIESAWGNSVARRVIRMYPTKAALDAAGPGTTDGELAHTTDNNVIWLRYFGAWLPTPMANRVSFSLIGGGAGQTIPTSTITTCVWSSIENDDAGVTSGGVFTCPAGWEGRWMFEFNVRFNGTAGGIRQAWILAGGNSFAVSTHETVSSVLPTMVTGTGSLALAVGQTAVIQLFHDNGSSMVVNNGGGEYFRGRYEGPY